LDDTPRVARWLTSATGNTMVEYMLLMAVLVLTCLAAGRIFGQALHAWYAMLLALILAHV
jgi:Flp pilus assembly pilin Flp